MATKAKKPSDKASAGSPEVKRGATAAKKPGDKAQQKQHTQAVPYGHPARKHTSQSITVAGVETNFSRADLQFDGIQHGGASYEARIFINNPEADAATPRTSDKGYAGRFHIFGHGGCYGDDEGHCEVHPRRAYDPRPEHPLTPATKSVIATEALRRALKQGKRITVTVVPIVLSGTPECDYENVVGFEKIKVLTYR